RKAERPGPEANTVAATPRVVGRGCRAVLGLGGCARPPRCRGAGKGAEPVNSAPAGAAHPFGRERRDGGRHPDRAAHLACKSRSPGHLPRFAETTLEEGGTKLFSVSPRHR